MINNEEIRSCSWLCPWPCPWLRRLCRLAPAPEEKPGEEAPAGNGSGIPGVEDGVLTIAMECAYAPYNWTQSDDSNGAVPIKDSTEYANGYDVMMAKKICEANGWELQMSRYGLGFLAPGVQSGVYDAVIPPASHYGYLIEQVDFAGPYDYVPLSSASPRQTAPMLPRPASAT